ncbi:MAG: hypothetical protein FWC27_14475 [Firmicutes bacterium]|nr:hypothetical protein [Bacillota bacterium]
MDIGIHVRDSHLDDLVFIPWIEVVLSISGDYAALKEQVLAAENIQWTAEKILREAKQPQKDIREKARVL